MGDSEEKQRGFDHWLSFKGQGVYAPDPEMLKAKGRFVPQATNSGFNLNGKRIPQKGYITDELTDYAEDWLAKKDEEKPFLLYVSPGSLHKGDTRCSSRTLICTRYIDTLSSLDAQKSK